MTTPCARCALPTSADAPIPEALADTSVAVAIVLADHEGHGATLRAVAGYRLGLAGHAWFETFSVLTRLPPGMRRSPADVRAILERDFPATRHLDEPGATALRRDLARLGISGGAVYDALVGAAARRTNLPLFSRDRRALPVYESLGVSVRLID
jgi:predicted nucleic acid-binding protein